MRWLSGLERPPKHLFVAHGEPEVAQSFADFVKAEKGWETSAPNYRDQAAIN
jgi:metallo-beta-lactamase family protein